VTRPIPMAPCIALLKAFDPNNESPQQTIAAASAATETALGAVDDTLNTGQFAALVDLWIWKGDDVEFATIKAWVGDGNFAKPVAYLATLGLRGLAERDVWNVGAAA
jgi:hypothetical protein